jgi:predicted phage tail protein
MAGRRRSDLWRNGDALVVLGALGMVFSLLTGACVGDARTAAALGVLASLGVVAAGVVLMLIDARRNTKDRNDG